MRTSVCSFYKYQVELLYAVPNVSRETEKKAQGLCSKVSPGFSQLDVPGRSQYYNSPKVKTIINMAERIKFRVPYKNYNKIMHIQFQ